MEQIAQLPHTIWISREELQKKITHQESFVIYHSLKGCPDCAHLDQFVLNNYLAQSSMQMPLYRIEVYPWRQYKNHPDAHLEQLWLDYISEFKLAFSYIYQGNPSQENLVETTARIPTLQVWNEGNMLDMVVYYNDRFSSGDWPKTIVGSFFEDGPIGCVLTSKEDYQQSPDILLFYQKKIVDFLNCYLNTPAREESI